MVGFSVAAHKSEKEDFSNLLIGYLDLEILTVQILVRTDMTGAQRKDDWSLNVPSHRMLS